MSKTRPCTYIHSKTLGRNRDRFLLVFLFFLFLFFCFFVVFLSFFFIVLLLMRCFFCLFSFRVVDIYILVCICIGCPVVCDFDGRLYRQLGGRNWVWNAVTSSLVFPLPLLGVFSVVNTIALYQVCGVHCATVS